MRTEKEIMEKYEKLIKEYPNDMDMVQDRIVCYMEDVEYKIPENDNTVKEVPLEELNDYIYDMEDIYLFSTLKESISNTLNSLSYREKYVLYHRIYLGMTLDQVAFILKVSRERIRQIEFRALRKSRHPSRSRKLKNFIIDTDTEVFPDACNDICDMIDIDIDKDLVLKLLNREIDVSPKKPEPPKMGDPNLELSYVMRYYTKYFKRIMYTNKKIKRETSDIFRIAVNISGIKDIYDNYKKYLSKEERQFLANKIIEMIDNKDISLLSNLMEYLANIARNNDKRKKSKSNMLYSISDLTIELFIDRVFMDEYYSYIPNSDDPDIIFDKFYRKIVINSGLVEYSNFIKSNELQFEDVDKRNFLRSLNCALELLEKYPQFKVYKPNNNKPKRRLEYEWKKYITERDSERDKHTTIDKPKVYKIDKNSPSDYKINNTPITTALVMSRNNTPKVEEHTEFVFDKPEKIIDNKTSILREYINNFERLKYGEIEPNALNTNMSLLFILNNNDYIISHAYPLCCDQEVFNYHEKIKTNYMLWVLNNPKKVFKIIKGLFVNGVIDTNNKQIHTDIPMSRMDIQMVYYTIKEFLEETKDTHNSIWNYSRIGGIPYMYPAMLDTLYMFCNCFRYELVD